MFRNFRFKMSVNQDLGYVKHVILLCNGARFVIKKIKNYKNIYLLI